MLSVGVIGLGIGEKLAQAFAGHSQSQVTALCDLSEERLDQVADEHPQARTSTDALTLLEDPSLDVICIASYDGDHHSQVIRALENGKHVLVEKPICLHEQELRSIRDCLNAHPDLRLTSNLNLRTCPRFRHMRELIRNGDMGNLFSFEADYLWGRPFKLTDGWRGDQHFYSIIHGAGVHMIDLILWATGKRPVTVQGMGNQVATAGSKLRYNDFATLLLGFEDGMVAKVASVSGSVHPHFHRVSVYGTEKTFMHEHTGARLYTTSNATTKPETVEAEYPGVAFKKQMVESFVDAISGTGQEPLASEEDVFAAMSVCLAGERAVKEGRMVEIEYI